MKGLQSGSKLRPERQARRKRRTCFIAAPARANLAPIVTVLREFGISPLVPSELPLGGGSVAEHVTGAIEKADILIAVLDPEESRANVYFELGYAYALKKRVLVLAPPKLETIPSDIKSMLYLRVDPTNRKAIRFALQQALAAPEPSRRRPRKPVTKTKPIGDLAVELVARLTVSQERGRERDIEEIVATAMEASGVSTVVRSDRAEVGADFAIWADELEPWVGNPLLIEVKKRLANRVDLHHVLDQMHSYLASTNSRWGLVLYASGPEWTTDYAYVSQSTVLLLTVRELLEKLRTGSFGEIIRDLRNRRVHGTFP